MRKLDFFASEDNLNLLSVSLLKQLAAEAGVESIKVACARLAGWASNLMLSGRRTS
jgi:hypothetical protein